MTNYAQFGVMIRELVEQSSEVDKLNPNSPIMKLAQDLCTTGGDLNECVDWLRMGEYPDNLTRAQLIADWQEFNKRR